MGFNSGFKGLNMVQDYSCSLNSQVPSQFGIWKDNARAFSARQVCRAMFYPL